MLLRDILASKGNRVVTCSVADRLTSAIDLLVRENIGSLVVCQGSRVVGILTERDVLRFSACDHSRFEKFTVAECMTENPLTGDLDLEVTEVMRLMTERRIRHLPVLHEGRLVGMISLGDLVKSQSAELTCENHYLRNYIHS